MELLLVLAGGVIATTSFVIGAKVGQSVKNGEPVKLPEINPFKAIEEHREKRAAEKEQSRIDTIMANIERYDGTSKGQEEVGG